VPSGILTPPSQTPMIWASLFRVAHTAPPESPPAHGVMPGAVTYCIAPLAAWTIPQWVPVVAPLRQIVSPGWGRSSP